MKTSEITRDVIAILIVAGAIASMFVSVQAGAEETIRVLAGAVIGYYFGAKALPVMTAMSSKKAKK